MPAIRPETTGFCTPAVATTRHDVESASAPVASPALHVLPPIGCAGMPELSRRGCHSADAPYGAAAARSVDGALCFARPAAVNRPARLFPMRLSSGIRHPAAVQPTPLPRPGDLFFFQYRESFMSISLHLSALLSLHFAPFHRRRPVWRAAGHNADPCRENNDSNARWVSDSLNTLFAVVPPMAIASPAP